VSVSGAIQTGTIWFARDVMCALRTISKVPYDPTAPLFHPNCRCMAAMPDMRFGVPRLR